MKTEQIIILVVAFFLGMLLLNMVKNVCGCELKEGFDSYDNAPPNFVATPGASDCGDYISSRLCNMREGNPLIHTRSFDCSADDDAENLGTLCSNEDTMGAEITAANRSLFDGFNEFDRRCANFSNLNDWKTAVCGGPPPPPSPPPCTAAQREQIKHNCLTADTDLSTKAGELGCTLPAGERCNDLDIATATTKVFTGTCEEVSGTTPCGEDVVIPDDSYQCPYLMENPTEDASICTDITRTTCQIKGTMDNCADGNCVIDDSGGGECTQQREIPDWLIGPAPRGFNKMTLMNLYKGGLDTITDSDGLSSIIGAGVDPYPPLGISPDGNVSSCITLSSQSDQPIEDMIENICVDQGNGRQDCYQEQPLLCVRNTAPDPGTNQARYSVCPSVSTVLG